MRSVVFDIETSDLAAVGAGVLLCAVLKPDGKQPIIFRADHYSAPLGKEEGLLTEVIDALSRYDLWVGHNIRRFDIAWLKSRAIQLGVDSFPFPFVYDTFEAFKRTNFLTVRNSFGQPTRRLDHVIDFFQLPQQKTALYPNEHWSTIWGDKKERKAALDKLVDHCVRDVKMNAAIYPRLLALDYRANIKRLI